MDTRRDRRHPERTIADLAARQKGVVTRAQLLQARLTERMVERRLQTGRLHRVFRGVYAVGHRALSPHARLEAAVLAAGDGALLSHRTAGWLWRVLPAPPPFVELTLPGRTARARSGLLVHRTTRATEVCRVDDLPVTSPKRTLIDLAAVMRPVEVQRAWTEAAALRLIRPEEIPAPFDAAPTRSVAERRFLAAVRAAQLPMPRVNHRIASLTVDFAWLEQRVIAETDGWATHGHRAAFERDRARDATLHADGYVVLRFTWRQLEREPLLVIARVAQTLAARGPHKT